MLGSLLDACGLLVPSIRRKMQKKKKTFTIFVFFCLTLKLNLFNGIMLKENMQIKFSGMI